MDFFIDYFSTVGERVRNVIDAQFDDIQETNFPIEIAKEAKQDSLSELCDDVNAKVTSADLNIVGGIANSSNPVANIPLIQCVNALASLGSLEEKLESSEVGHFPNTETPIIVEDVHSTRNSELPSTEQLGPDLNKPQDLDMGLTSWLSGLSSRSEEVWQRIKHDFTEVVNFVSVEPKDAATRTASSVRQHLSAVASAMGKVDPHHFTLLPESEVTEAVEEQKSDPSPGPSEFPSLSTLRSDLKQLFSEVMSNLFGSDEGDTTPSKSKREARLHILRADPATYEVEPPPPPEDSGLLSYRDWRAAYFDEVQCQPLPGVPLYDVRAASYTDYNAEDVLEPPHPSPEELLEQNPFMRTYLSQLVRVDGDSKGISDADFWSRYYYRVWLMHVMEKRRQHLTQRVEATLPSNTHQSGETCSHDWFDDSDIEVPVSDTSVESKQHTASNAHPSIESNVISPSKSTPRLASSHSKKRACRKSKRTDTTSPNNTEPHDHPVSSSSDTLPPVSSATRTIHNDNTDGSLTFESDDTATSESSLVIVSASADDAEILCPSAKSLHVPPKQMTPVNPPCVPDDPSDNLDSSSDDWWGEVRAEDMPESSHTQNISNTNSKADDLKNDWDDWS